MRFSTATSAGHPGRANEDFVGTIPDAVVLVDGAGIRGAEHLCRHGVAWYAHGLGGALLARLSRSEDLDLREHLSRAIDEVTDRHRDSCAVGDPSSPSATVAVVRWVADRVEHLVLGDSVVVLGHAVGPVVVEDRREPAIARPLQEALAALPPGSSEYDRAREEAITTFRAWRNQPGGFWVAKDVGAVAAEATAGSHTAADVSAVVVLSNGASRVVDRFALLEWADLSGRDPAEVIRLVRDAEAAESVDADDATLAVVHPLASTA